MIEHIFQSMRSSLFIVVNETHINRFRGNYFYTKWLNEAILRPALKCLNKLLVCVDTHTQSRTRPYTPYMPVWERDETDFPATSVDTKYGDWCLLSIYWLLLIKLSFKVGVRMLAFYT